MSFLGDKILKKELKDLIVPYDEENLESAHYELTFGSEAYLTNSVSNKKDILNDENTILSIEPGQFALLMTHEAIKVPNNRIAFISIKAGLKFKGLVNISGFHVDPGFEGKLLFSVYNAGPSPILLERGQKCFLIWYSKLDGEADYEGKHNGQQKIPLNHIQDLTGKLASPNVLLKRVDSIDSKMERHLWAIGIVISVAITICFFVYKGSDRYDNGFKDGFKSKDQEIYLQDKIDKAVIIKMDSIIKSNSIQFIDSGGLKKKK